MWETWRPNGPRPALCHIYFIRDLVVLALCLGLGIVLLEYIVALRVCSLQPWQDMVPEKPYVNPDSDLVVTWAQRKSTTLTCFGNCEVLATFRQKLLEQNIQTKKYSRTLERTILSYSEPLAKNCQFSNALLLNSPPCMLLCYFGDAIRCVS